MIYLQLLLYTLLLIACARFMMSTAVDVSWGLSLNGGYWSNNNNQHGLRT